MRKNVRLPVGIQQHSSTDINPVADFERDKNRGVRRRLCRIAIESDGSQTGGRIDQRIHGKNPEHAARAVTRTVFLWAQWVVRNQRIGARNTNRKARFCLNGWVVLVDGETFILQILWVPAGIAHTELAGRIADLHALAIDDGNTVGVIKSLDEALETHQR